MGFGFSGFQLLCIFGLVNGFCGGLLMTALMVVALFSVFCFAMDYGCHDGGGGGLWAIGGDGGSGGGLWG